MKLSPAFVNPLGLVTARRPLLPRAATTKISRPRPIPHIPTTRRMPPRMLGPFRNLGDSNLLKSPVVRQEKESLERDYFELAKLGETYQKFDREGKLIYIERAMDVLDRFHVFLSRLKLSDEFANQIFIKQYQLQLQEYGFTIDSLIENTKKSLEMMKDDIPAS